MVPVPVTGEQQPQQPDSSLPSPSPDYVNVNALNERRERPERADNLSNELRQMGIPPDASYSDSYSKRPATEKKPSPLSKEQVLLPGSKYSEQLSLGVGHFYPAVGSKTALTATTHKLISAGITEDRGSNGKHSDSGYDTLRAQEAAEAKRSALRSPTAHPLLCEPADESHLIKEFSYQYIHETATAESTHQKSLGKTQKQISPKNLIQNKTKITDKNITASLEREVSPLINENLKKQDGLKMQEPLQPSQPIYHSNEAHVSSIKSADRENEVEATQDIANLRKSRQNSLRTFAFGDSSPEEKVTTRRKQTSNPKSVRDLLADFERKSAALAKEQQAEQERSNVLDAAGRRCVFSDTETLLYDTSSDTELPVTGSDEPRGKREMVEPSLPRQHPRRCVSRAGDRSEDEEDDEEVAAALGRREKFFSSCRDLGRRKDSAQPTTSKEAVNLNVRRRKVSRSKPQPTVDEVIVTPGYLRLSLAESMVAHEDSASSRSSPSPNPPMNETSHDKTPEVAAAEEHYMPMTPSRRAVLAPPALLLEESSYVEMAEDGGVRSLPSIFKRDEVRRLNSGDSTATYATPDSPRYCEIDDNDKEESSHYEFLYHATTKYEPVYMEVRPIDALKPLNLSNKSNKDDAKSIDNNKDFNTTSTSKTVNTGDDNNSGGGENLPDILNSTSGSTQQGKTDDSEDADDEASKDLDSLDTPRHPRFSLSDTFRPASYYLGASECAPEQHDSSDSDLVSPPPIPTSPPPLDDDLEEDFSLELRKNSHSTPSETRKFPDHTSSPSRSDRRSLQGSLDGSIISDTLTDSSRLKRRPVSEEMLNSLEENSFLMNSMSESISGASTITSTNRDSTSLSRFSLQDELRARDALLGYPKDLTYGFSEAAYHKESFQQRENMYATNKPAQKDTKSEMLLLSNRVRFAPDVDEPIREIPPPINPESILMRSRHIRSPSLEEALNSNLDIQQASAAPEVPEEAAKTSAQTSFDSGAETAGAPYYYSDLLRADEDGFASSTSEISLSRLPPLPQVHANMAARARIPQLNNQRDMLDANKRNDIGRKVNPIISAPVTSSPSTLIRVEIEDSNVTRIAAEIRTTTAGLAAKSVSVDSRNIYEADTLRKMARRRDQQVQRRRSQTPDPDLETRNLYPHGLRDKSEVSFESRRRSRSLEGLLDDDENFLDPPRLPPSAAPQERRRRSSGTPRSGHGRSTAPSEGSDPWEQDVLWRESLRRVSLRHTRSLDDLDEDESSPAAPGPSIVPPSGRRSVDMLSSRDRVARVSREVTYVNDVAARNRMLRTKREVYETDYREGRRGGPHPPPPPQNEEEDTGVYERLARTTESLDRSRRGQTYVEGYEWDVDRETFRQGIVPDSAQRIVRERNQQQQQQTQQQQQQQHFLEESLPPSFEIDREKLRQWDLLSSAPLEGGVAVTVGTISTTTASTTSHQRPVGGEGREGSIIANPNIPPAPTPPNTGEAGGGGRHLDSAMQQQQQQHIGEREPPPPPPPPVQPLPLQPPEGMCKSTFI